MRERVSIGIPGLDEVLSGGLLVNQSYLIVGSAGTGKTLSSLQWLASCADEGKTALFITLAEPLENVLRNVSNFTWNLDKLHCVDLNPTSDRFENRREEYTVFPPSDVERAPMWSGMYDAINEVEPDCVVIDSVTQLHYLSTDDYQFRRHLLAFVTFLREKGCTSILTFEPTELERGVSVGLAVDGILRLRMEISPNRLTGLRSVEIQKMRGSDFISGLHPLRITEEGLRVYPHRIEKPGDTKPGTKILSSGIDNLDKLIGGGLESGTATIMSGPSGVGKSTLAMQFLTEAAKKGERAVYYTFEESPRSIVARAHAIGLPVKEQLASGMLEIVRVNPMELFPDEFLSMVRMAIEEEGRNAIVIDSLRGYELAMEEFGSLVANIQNLVTFLNRKAVTTVLINEVEKITGDLMPTEVGVSYLSDSVLLLRYAEKEGRVVKVISCLKKRYGTFDTALSELTITGDGIKVSKPLNTFTGILSGAPKAPSSSEDGTMQSATTPRT